MAACAIRRAKVVLWTGIALLLVGGVWLIALYNERNDRDADCTLGDLQDALGGPRTVPCDPSRPSVFPAIVVMIVAVGVIAYAWTMLRDANR